MLHKQKIVVGVTSGKLPWLTNPACCYATLQDLCAMTKYEINALLAQVHPMMMKHMPSFLNHKPVAG